MLNNMNEENTIVNGQLIDDQSSDDNIETIPEEIVTQHPAGSKTESELLLKSLKEEREKRREDAEKIKLLEEELLKSSTSENVIFSDEGEYLKKQISSLSDKIRSIESDKDFQGITNQFPILKEKLDEFKTFQLDYPSVKLEQVAKLFLSENGLFNKPRKGLEKPTGGSKAPFTTGMTADDIKTLRETNYKKYTEMLMKGLIKISS